MAQIVCVPSTLPYRAKVNKQEHALTEKDSAMVALQQKHSHVTEQLKVCLVTGFYCICVHAYSDGGHYRCMHLRTYVYTYMYIHLYSTYR